MPKTLAGASLDPLNEWGEMDTFSPEAGVCRGLKTIKGENEHIGVRVNEFRVVIFIDCLSL